LFRRAGREAGLFAPHPCPSPSEKERGVATDVIKWFRLSEVMKKSNTIYVINGGGRVEKNSLPQLMLHYYRNTKET
jgi:hypothetical protein